TPMFVSAQNFQSSDPTFGARIVILQHCGVDALFLDQLCARAAQVLRACGDNRTWSGVDWYFYLVCRVVDADARHHLDCITANKAASANIGPRFALERCDSKDNSTKKTDARHNCMKIYLS